MKKEFSGTCPKDLQEPGLNEDQFCFSDDGFRLGLCDGASESYNSQLWAKIISEKFAADPNFGSKWIIDALSIYIAAHDFPNMSWSQQSSYERGSFSTLLGIDFDPVHRVVDILAIGDCSALLVDEGRFIKAWPITDPERFKDHPTLLSTLAQHNAFIVETEFCEKTFKNIHLKDYVDPRLYCMTDALGEWALRHALASTDGLERLSSLTTEQELCELVTEERSAKRMRVDDSTLIILSF
ncbi:MAG: hypothetical protein PHX60_09925 [Giesbergeria sp.]|uniref:hypothetical protein n=1 Tax=Giesbergeria sp. TaxID=2818473 RepID=UPI002637B1A2|nr:hypothetical protein [Giesbergeria sp.]MDD2609995.1 hypothetical protein [Giesbergeria sp.]